MGAIIVGVIATLLFGGLMFGILLSLWNESRRDMTEFFVFWLVAGVSGWFFIEGWAGIL